MEFVRKAQEHLAKAIEMKEGAVAWYREQALAAQSELADIRLDDHLTQDGKFAKMDELRSKRGKELLKKLQAKNDAYRKELEQAKRFAEREVFAKPNKPDAEVIERFKSDFQRMKTRVLLDTRPESAVNRLSDFVDGIDNAYLAGIVADDFAGIVGAILEGASPGRQSLELRKKLASIYDRLESGFISEEQAQARELLRMSSAMLATPNVLGGNLTVKTNAREVFGVAIADALDDPASYFAQNDE